MPEAKKSGFDVNQFSQAETDEEFGLPEFKEHFADTLTPAVLKDWTAQDFASIYVRFRPHLERHARRFLVNPSQVEEVVQDAFLYLMTSLPELDSELGVLKFLKWKTRLLCLDLLRSNSRSTYLSLEEHPELDDGSEDMSTGIERADNAAIVALALSKLQPRQREALLATLYEEKSIPEVASQMGLNDNAFRQLLHRARKSFKAALAGEAEARGKTLSEILAFSGRRIRKSGSTAVAVLAALGLPLILLSGPVFGPSGGQDSALLQGTDIAIAPPEKAPLTQPFDSRPPTPGESSSLVASEAQSEPTQSEMAPTDDGNQAYQESERAEAESEGTSEVNLEVDAPESSGVQAAAFDWATKVLTDLSAGETSHVGISKNQISIEIGSSAVLNLVLTDGTDSVIGSALLFGLEDQSHLVAVPTGVSEATSDLDSGAAKIRIIMTGFAVGDLSGPKSGSSVLEDSHFSEIGVDVELLFADSSLTELISAGATFLPRA